MTKNNKEAAECQKIMRYLKSGAMLTAKNALQMFDCWQLHKRIAELRKSGNEIKTRYVNNGTRHIKVYFLPKP